MSHKAKLEQLISLFCAVGLVFPLTSTCAEPAAAKQKLPPVLSQLQAASQQALDKIDQSVASAAKKLSAVADLKSDEARKILLEMHQSCPFAIDCCIITPEAKMLVVEPAAFKHYEGSDLSKQEHVARIIRTKTPLMSDQFKTIEGVLAVDIEYPIIAADGKFAGLVSMIFQPHLMLGKIIPPLIQGIPVEAWAMQKDGLTIYDADADEIGRMLFSDPLYKPFPELLKLGKRMSAEHHGMGSYKFFKAGTKEQIAKETWWTSIGLHGTEWRLIQTHPMGSVHKDISHAPVTLDALKELAGKADLAKALARNDRESAMTLFKGFAMSFSGVYSISWIDANCVSQFGYPPENSLLACDLNKDTTLSGVFCVKSVKAKTEASCEDTLLEGGRARFTFVPMTDGQTSLGGLLLIQRL